MNRRAGFCTLAIHAPYRKRARLLCADRSDGDRLSPIAPTGNNRGAAAYHDKRFALQAALEDFETAVFLDADSRVGPLPSIEAFPPGIAVVPLVRKTVAEHLETCGAWRLPAFITLARELTGTSDVLREARWCHETPLAVTKDGREEEQLGRLNERLLLR